MSEQELDEQIRRDNREAFARLNAEESAETTLADAIVKLLHFNPWGPC